MDFLSKFMKTPKRNNIYFKLLDQWEKASIQHLEVGILDTLLVQASWFTWISLVILFLSSLRRREVLM